MPVRAALWLVLALAAFAGGARAQTAPVLLADRVSVDAPSRTLIAEGNVEVFYEGVRLSAARATYRDGADRVEIAGPITLVGPEGRTVVLAESAALSADLQNGLLTGAQMLLERELQLTAGRIERIDGRYTRLENSVATACRICPGGGPPIWELRGRKIVHDQIDRQLYFTDAQLRVFGVPIAWVPRLRLPDPTVERMSGFLIPRIRNSDNLGFGVKIPYFLTLGEHADVLITPWITDTSSRTLEYRYRQAFRSGAIEIDGAVSRDNLTNEPWRAYVFADGAFDLPRDYRLRFDVELVSDRGYLLEYDYSSKDRLDSALSIERILPDRFTGAQIIGFQSLREDDADNNSPVVVGDALWAWRLTPPALGGRAQITTDLQGHGRDGGGDGASARDVLRLSGRGDWRRDWRLWGGMRSAAIARIDGDFYAINEDSDYDDIVLRLVPRLAAELRWPLIKRGTAATHLLEPITQVVWASDTGGTVPNEDSVLVEFDETNLFALSRFPGRDAYEEGLFANLGLLYTRQDRQGLPLRLAFGRVLRATDRNQFTQPTGLDGRVSDWVTAAHIAFTERSGMIARAVFDNNLILSNTEVRLGIEADRFDLATTYLWVESDPAEGMVADMSEWTFDAGWQISDYWRTRAGWRYDAVDGEPTRARLGLVYENECIAVELSAQRRFTESRDVTPSTDFSLILSFDGIGDRGARPPARQCRG